MSYWSYNTYTCITALNQYLHVIDIKWLPFIYGGNGGVDGGEPRKFSTLHLRFFWYSLSKKYRR